MSQEAKGSGNEYVTLQDHSTGKNYDLPLMPGSIGPKVIDVRPLYAQTGHFTYDPGYTSTGSCESKITYIDGEEGVLLHRGYPIEELAEQSTFLELCYLLLNGELPSKAEYEDFDSIITNHTMVHEQLHKFYDGFRRDAHPMADHVRRCRRSFRLLPRFNGYRRSAAADDRFLSSYRQDADDRRLGL